MYNTFTSQTRHCSFVSVILFFISILYCPIITAQDGDKLFGKGMDFSKSNLDSAFHYLQLAERKYASSSNWQSLISTQEKLGNLYFKTRNNDKAISYFEKAIKQSKMDSTSSPIQFGNLHHNLGRALYGKQDWEKAIEIFSLALEIRKKHLAKDHIDVSKTIHNLAQINFNYHGDYEQSYKLYKEALRIKRIHLDENQQTVLNSIGGIAKSLNYMGRHEEGIVYGERAKKITEAIYAGDNSNRGKYNLGGNYNNLAIYYIDAYKCEKAIPLLKRAKALLNEIGDGRINVKYFINMGRAYSRMNDWGTSREYYKEAVEESKKRYESPFDSTISVANAYTGIGHTYHFGERDYQKAIQSFQKSLDLKKTVLDSTHAYIRWEHINLALSYSMLMKISEAEKHYQQAIDLTKKANASFYPLMLNYGLFQNKKRDFLHAQQILQDALDNEQEQKNIDIHKTSKLKLELYNSYLGLEKYQLAYSMLQDLKKQLSQKEIVKNYNLEYLLLETLEKEGEFLFRNYQLLELTQKEAYQKVLNNYLEIIKVIGVEKIRQRADESKNFTMERVHQIYEKSLNITFDLMKMNGNQDYKKLSYELFEKSKTGLMREALANSRAKNLAGVSNEWLQKEDILKDEIALLEEQLNFEILKNNQDESVLIKELSEKLNSKKLTYYNFLDLTEKKYPEYYRLKHSGFTIKLDKIQRELLDENSSILEYFVGEENIFVFLLSKEDYQVFRLENNFDLEGLVQNALSINSSEERMKNDGYINALHEIYLNIFKPIEGELKKNIRIIPDGPLLKIPFESLIMELPSKSFRFKSHKYLLEKYLISYDVSASLFYFNQTRKKVSTPYSSLCIAPFDIQDSIVIYHDENIKRTGFGPLINSGKEIEFVSEITKGEAYYGNTGTEHLLKEKASAFNIIHLATHGMMNENNTGYLAFNNQNDSLENGMLFLSEIYGLNLNSNMTVLSACDSGVGKFQKGEGSLSLARAFLLAGSSSVVNTLWKVDDSSTQQIMIDYYKFLEKGMQKNEALRKAKLEYLSKNDNAKSHPYFWSGITLFGDNSKLNFN